MKDPTTTNYRNENGAKEKEERLNEFFLRLLPGEKTYFSKPFCVVELTLVFDTRVGKRFTGM